MLDTLLLPSSTYRSNRHSMMAQEPDGDAGGEFLIPVAFDPNEENGSSRPASNTAFRDQGPSKSSGSSRRSSRFEQPVGSASPHIAYQEKERDQLDHPRASQDEDDVETHQDGGDYFKPRDSRRGKSVSTHSSSSRPDPPAVSAFSPASPDSGSGRSRDISSPDPPKSTAPETTILPSRPAHDLHKLHENASIDSAVSGNSLQYPPKRGDSLASSRMHQIPRKEPGASPSVRSPTQRSEDWNDGASHDGMSPQKPSLKGTPRMGESSLARSDLTMEPPKVHARGNSLSTVQSDSHTPADRSPSLPRYSTGGDLSMDDDVARMMGPEDAHTVQNRESLLRRVSNSVRHGRSFSDKSLKPAKGPKSPMNGLSEGGSPAEEVAWLRNELRKERLRVVEKEQKLAEMESLLNTSADVKQVNTELHEKRSTMVVLDAQKEVVMRELSVLTDHLEAEKHGARGPMDLGQLTNTVLREFVESIQKLKESYTPQIEEQIQRRNDLAEELASLNRMKDKSFQEFEQLSSKNAQLAELNNQLVHQIQELYKASSQEPSRPANGLGIYGHSKEKSTNSVEAVKPPSDATPSMTTTNLSEEAEPATIVPGPQVISIRKGQPRKFNWKKGQNVAKGVTKGLKGAFMGSETQDGFPRSQSQDPARQGFGFFGNQRNKQAGTKMPQADSVPALNENSTSSMFFSQRVIYADVEDLYGTDLEQRLEYERGIIPAIVTRCIQEVELRGRIYCFVVGGYANRRRNGHGRNLPQIRRSLCNPDHPRRFRKVTF